jgi:hypothetical protein
VKTTSEDIRRPLCLVRFNKACTFLPNREPQTNLHAIGIVGTLYVLLSDSNVEVEYFFEQ